MTIDTMDKIVHWLGIRDNTCVEVQVEKHGQIIDDEDRNTARVLQKEKLAMWGTPVCFSTSRAGSSPVSLVTLGEVKR